MILINGAPGTGKSTLAKVLCASISGTLHQTDNHLDVPHTERVTEILRCIERHQHFADYQIDCDALIVEGCEVDRLIKHYLEERLSDKHKELFVYPKPVLFCTGFETTREGCAGLAARARKYFELWPGKKYLVRGVQTSDS